MSLHGGGPTPPVRAVDLSAPRWLGCGVSRDTRSYCHLAAVGRSGDFVGWPSIRDANILVAMDRAGSPTRRRAIAHFASLLLSGRGRPPPAGATADSKGVNPSGIPWLLTITGGSARRCAGSSLISRYDPYLFVYWFEKGGIELRRLH